MTATEPQGFLKDDANIERLCGLAGVSRTGFCRRRRPSPPSREETDLRGLIQRIALTDRHYGYRRIAVELRRQGLIVKYAFGDFAGEGRAGVVLSAGLTHPRSQAGHASDQGAFRFFAAENRGAILR
jgi:hypothetical protein